MKVPFMDLTGCYEEIYEEIMYKLETLIKNTRFIGGEEVTLFEEEFAAYCKTKYAVGCSNGTDALILALKILDIGYGDTVLVPANTFIATSEAVTAVGAKVEFIDVEEKYYTLDPAKLENHLERNPGIKAVIPVHLYGQMADMPLIMKIAQKYDVKVIEDSAQAHGAQLNNQGPGHSGELATFSFYPGKNLGAFGDAGAVITNNETYYRKAKMLVDHGRWQKKYEHDTEGYNKRLDSLQAAVLRVKLKNLARWTEKRRTVAAKYIGGLQEKPVILPHIRPGADPVWHLFVIRTADRDRKMALLKEKGISTGIHYPIPLHLQKAYSYLGYKKGDFPVTEKCAPEIMSLPLWPEISDEQIEYVCRCID